MLSLRTQTLDTAIEIDDRDIAIDKKAIDKNDAVAIINRLKRVFQENKARQIFQKNEHF